MTEAADPANEEDNDFETPETYEEGLERLEAVVNQLEEEDLPLDRALEFFQEGVSLARYCAGRLDEAEARIETLIENEEGALERVPFALEEDRHEQ